MDGLRLFLLREISESLRERILWHWPWYVVGIYVVTGILGLFVTHSLYEQHYDVLLAAGICLKLLEALALGFIIAGSVNKCGWQLSDWGFTLSRGAWVSLGLSVVWFIFLGGRVGWGLAFFSPIDLISSTTEELILRVLFISQLVILIGRGIWGKTAALLISAIVFTLLHAPLVGSPMLHASLQGIFLTSVLMGAVYVWTRSILFLMFLHVVGNTGDGWGLLGPLFAVAVYFLLAGLDKVLKRHQLARSPRIESP